MRPVPAIVLAAVLVGPSKAEANKVLDYIRSYDLNNYALGIAISGSQNPYVGAKLQIFRIDFDRYEGSLNYGALDIQRRLGEKSASVLHTTFTG